MDTRNWDKTLLPYEQAVDELIVKFKNLDASFRRLNMASPIELVEGRVKRLSSILEKARRKNVSPEVIEEYMEDIAGVRIICRFVEDIDRVRDIIRSRDGVDLEIIKEHDYVANAKASGYRSYHIIVTYPVISASGYKKVTCEVQIRTLAMNFWATIEHSLKYKYKGKLPEHLQQRLISCADAAAKLDAEMSEIRGEVTEVESGIESRNKVVDLILDRLQALYQCADLDQVTELNRSFFDLYEKGDMEGLNELYRQLNVMAELYRV